MTIDYGLAISLIVALGLAIRFAVCSGRADKRIAELEFDMIRVSTLELELRIARRDLDDMTRKRDDAWRRYLDSLDEIAELRAESNRGDAA